MPKKEIRRLVVVLLILISCLYPTFVWGADTFAVRVTAGSDDAEEFLDSGSCTGGGTWTKGEVDLVGSRLDFGYDIRDCSWPIPDEKPNMLIGLRFQGVQVPAGATITFAKLEITANDRDDAISWKILGENVDSAATYTTTAFGVSSRKSGQPTTTFVDWIADGEGGNNYRTKESPDLKAIVQEIVDRGGWVAGNAMAFFLQGSGRRNAYSSEGNSTSAPRLHIEYLPASKPEIAVDPSRIGLSSYQGANPGATIFTLQNTGSGDLNFTISDNVTWLSSSPTSGTIAAGGSITVTVTYATTLLGVGTHEATITITDPNADNSPLAIPVSLAVQAMPTRTTCGEVPLYTENLVNPAILHLLDVSGSMRTQMELFSTSADTQTPNLKDIVQEIVDRGGWAAGNSLSFIFTSTSSSDRAATSFDSSSAYAPRLTVEYIDGFVSQSTEARILRSSDDAHEVLAGGTMNLTNTSVQIGGNRASGFRFENVDIPAGATITNAYINFQPSSSGLNAVEATIHGEDADNPSTYTSTAGDLSSRIKTTNNVVWDIGAWAAPVSEKRIKIARDVLSELVKDRSIAWGFGTWTGDNNASDKYTEIHTGCKFNDDTHQTALQNAIAGASEGGSTPLEPAMQAAQEYFGGTKADEEGDSYTSLTCQPKFLILITDGLGNTATTDAGVRTEAGNLADDVISSVAIGFGIDNATQINEIARISNERGNLRADDSLYAMHGEVDGVGVPFIAQNKTDLEKTLKDITTSVKAQVFYGSTPAPTTSAGQQDLIVNAQFNAGGWTGDLVATEYDPVTSTIGAVRWTASSVMPITKKAYTVEDANLAVGTVTSYTDAILAHDNYLCKPLGDIINSTPKIVDAPPFYYPFDGYPLFQATKGSRDTMVYVGSNDGALHAFTLEDGIEQWRFYPNSVLAKLDEASDSTKDMCSSDFCHRYLVDGSPVAADIFDGSIWKTMLVSGMRRGGTSYFALDVTGGKPFDDADIGNRSDFMWEFTDGELGQTWGQPEIYRVAEKGSLTDTVWGVFFGSGYADDNTDQAGKEAYLYGVEANDAAVALWQDGSGNPLNRIKISSAPLADDALGGVLVAEMNDDYQGDRLYVGNLYGTMSRVSDLEKDATPVVSTLFDFGRTPPDHTTPIRVKPAYAYHRDNDIFVYYGTGSYEVQADKATGDMQYFFGLRDDATKPTYNLATLPIFSALKATDAVTLESYRYIFGAPPGPAPYSWAIELNNRAVSGASERVISDPLVVGGVVFFTTFTPAADVCEGTGESWLFALEYDTGMPPAKPVFDINGDEVFDDNDMITDNAGNKYRVAAIPLGNDLASNPVLHKDTLVVGTKTAGTITHKVNLPKMAPKLRSWWETR